MVVSPLTQPQRDLVLWFELLAFDLRLVSRRPLVVRRVDGPDLAGVERATHAREVRTDSLGGTAVDILQCNCQQWKERGRGQRERDRIKRFMNRYLTLPLRLAPLGLAGVMLSLILFGRTVPEPLAPIQPFLKRRNPLVGGLERLVKRWGGFLRIFAALWLLAQRERRHAPRDRVKQMVEIRRGESFLRGRVRGALKVDLRRNFLTRFEVRVFSDVSIQPGGQNLQFE